MIKTQPMLAETEKKDAIDFAGGNVRRRIKILEIVADVKEMHGARGTNTYHEDAVYTELLVNIEDRTGVLRFNRSLGQEVVGREFDFIRTIQKGKAQAKTDELVITEELVPVDRGGVLAHAYRVIITEPCTKGDSW